MTTASLQLAFFEVPAAAPKKVVRHLDRPLSREEQRRFGRMYAANVRLVRKFAARLRQQYGHCVAAEDINSCCDLAFLKACRAWDPDRGALSTIYWKFARGEVLHFLRGNNWGISATHRARELGLAARRLLDAGISVDVACQELSCSPEDIRLALVATAGMAHDTMGFDLHVCSRPTPMEWLEESEAT